MLVIAAVALPEPLRVYPVFAYWAAGVAMAVLFVGSMLAHELAHLVVARRLGVRVERVTLWLGGESPSWLPHRAPRTELLISAAGPTATLTIGGVLLAVSAVGTVLGFPMSVLGGLVWLALVNGVMGLANLLSGMSLDGRQMLYAALRRRSKDPEHAAALVRGVCRILGGLVLLVGITVVIIRAVLSGPSVSLLGIFLASDGNHRRRPNDRPPPRHGVSPPSGAAAGRSRLHGAV